MFNLRKFTVHFMQLNSYSQKIFLIYVLKWSTGNGKFKIKTDRQPLNQINIKLRPSISFTVLFPTGLMIHFFLVFLTTFWLRAVSPSAPEMLDSSRAGIVMILVPSGRVGRLISSFSILKEIKTVSINKVFNQWDKSTQTDSPKYFHNSCILTSSFVIV